MSLKINRPDGFTLLEVLAPLCLLSRRFRLIFAAVMVPFHLLATVVFHVSFWENLVLYGCLVDASIWPRILRK